MNQIMRFKDINYFLSLPNINQINVNIYTAHTKARPHLFDIKGLCANYPLTSAPDEYFVAHEVSPEKIEDLRHALKQGLASTELKPYTADQDIRPGHILCKIAAKIQTTAFCIFDLPQSLTNASAANVYLELGIAMGLGRPFILIKNEQAQVPSLLEGLETFGFGSYSGLRREVGEQVKIGQFSAILPLEDVSATATYFLADGEFEQEDFREAIRNALEDYELQPVYLAEGQVEPALVLTQLIRNMQAARFGIYRIDQQASANTFLALGIAIGLNKPWLLVAREGATIPQDVRGLSNFNFRSFTQLESEFVGRCREFLQRYAQQNSVHASPVPQGSTAKNTNPPTPKAPHHSLQIEVPEQTVRHKSIVEEKSMAGIPSHLSTPLREALADCEQFETNRSLRSIFVHEFLRPWRNSLPQADTLMVRVDAVINYLHDKRRRDGTNVLVLLLRVLSSQIDSEDDRHHRLATLANDLELALGGASARPRPAQIGPDVSKPTAGVSQPAATQTGPASATSEKHQEEQPKSKSKDFFISYNRHDRQWAEWIAWQLEATGFTTVIQAWDFRPGGNFVADMQQAASEAKRTIAVLSPDYLTSGFAQSEWNAAFAQDPTGKEGLLLPVRVRDCELEGLLSQIVYIDLVGLDQEIAKTELLNGIKRDRAKPTIEPGFPGAGPSSSEPPEFPGETSNV